MAAANNSLFSSRIITGGVKPEVGELGELGELGLTNTTSAAALGGLGHVLGRSSGTFIYLLNYF